MNECIDLLGDTKSFNTFDASNIYWQVSIEPNDRHKTSFVCHAGTYQ